MLEKQCYCLAVLLLLPTTVHADYASTILADDPVGYWRLDDPSGSTTAMNIGSAGYTLDGTYTADSGKVVGIGMASGLSGGARFVNPNPGETTGNHVAGTGMTGVFDNSWTIEGWSIRESKTNSSAIFSNNGPPSYGAPSIMWGHEGLSQQNRIVYANVGHSWDQVYAELGSSSVNRIVYTALTYDKTTNKASLYTNMGGVWRNSISQTVPWTITPGDVFQIGQLMPSGYAFDGTISDVAVYSTALSEAAIMAHYAAAGEIPDVPEPTSIAMTVSAMLGLLAYAWKKRR